MSEAPTIAGGNLNWEAHKRLRQHEEIVYGDGIVLRCGEEVLWVAIYDTDANLMSLVSWLRDRDAG